MDSTVDAGANFTHPALTSMERQISARKNQRCAWDGCLYTLAEFLEYYGEDTGLLLWKEASHFQSLYAFCEWLDLEIVRYPRCDQTTLYRTSCTVFGLWVPGCILILDVHHLTGKLRPSRLAPDRCFPDIWQDAWIIGPTHATMKVLDLCTEILASGDPLSRLGKKEMLPELEEFRRFTDNGFRKFAKSTNGLVNFLSVDEGPCPIE